MTNRIHGVTRTVLWTLCLFALALPVQAQELALGSKIPGADAARTSVTGQSTSIAAAAGSAGTVVVFWSNQCPWVEKYNGRFAQVVSDFSDRGIGFVLINSNDVAAFPQESSEESARVASKLSPGLTYLSDPKAEIATAFGAERTPHIYLFDGAGELVYVGTIDDSPGDPANVKTSYLRDALDAVASGRAVAVPKTKAFGCTIKSKS